MFKKTNFPFFDEECSKLYGNEKGKRIYNFAEKRLSEMIKEADNRNSKAIKKHMEINLLPTIAMYFSFIEEGFSKDEAYKNTLKMTEKACYIVKKNNEKIGRMPFGYTLFKLFCKKIINENYPTEGWDIEWIQKDKDRVHFDMKRCIYVETTTKYNCPELCPIFCNNDTITLAGYAPNIIFERKGTIALGQKVCDFNFENGKKKIKFF